MSERLYKCDSDSSFIKTLGQLVGDQRFFVVLDQALLALHDSTLNAVFALPNFLAAYYFEASEKNKSLATSEAICDRLLSFNLTRHDYVVAIGGGITSDIAAFSATIAKRGMRLILVPTTLLAMVDAAIGGKNGVNTSHGKNSIGCFCEAQAIVYKHDFLSSLSSEEWQNGRGECIKYSFLEQTFNLAETLAPLDQFKHYAIQNTMYFAQYKESIVAVDLYDRGQRQTLNFGHTFGHALESANQTLKLSHGKAVMIGIAIALALSKAHLGLEQQLVDDYYHWLFKQKWFQTDYLPPFDKLEYFIRRDKKNSSQKITMVLLAAIGNPKLVDLEIDQLGRAYRGFCDASAHSTN